MRFCKLFSLMLSQITCWQCYLRKCTSKFLYLIYLRKCKPIDFSVSLQYFCYMFPFWPYSPKYICNGDSFRTSSNYLFHESPLFATMLSLSQLFLNSSLSFFFDPKGFFTLKHLYYIQLLHIVTIKFIAFFLWLALRWETKILIGCFDHCCYMLCCSMFLFFCWKNLVLLDSVTLFAFFMNLRYKI